MIVGYARTSTVEQVAGYEAQIRDLEAAGCERVYREQVSSVDVVNRAELETALDFVRAKDTFVVTKLDRLARSVSHLLEIAERLEKKGVALRILNLGIDTSTPTGRLLLTMVGGIAQFEREIMLERQREGIAKAKAEGKYRGRKATAQAKAADVRAMRAAGASVEKIIAETGISRASVFRIVRG